MRILTELLKLTGVERSIVGVRRIRICQICGRVCNGSTRENETTRPGKLRPLCVHCVRKMTVGGFYLFCQKVLLRQA